MPIGDEREHEESTVCWCDPRVEWADPETRRPWANGGCRVTHNAADCRELVERAMGGEPYGGWMVVTSTP